MSTKRALSFLQRGWTALTDPGRESRLQDAVSTLQKELSRNRAAFDFNRIVEAIPLSDDDARECGRRLFSKYLDKFWSDGNISSKEQEGLDWLAKRISLSEREASDILRERATSEFATRLSSAFADGVLDDKEYEELKVIAATCGETPGQFFRDRFSSEGEGFIRVLFSTILEDGRLDGAEWKILLKTVNRLGMTDDEFRSAIQVPARQLLEHVLADAKSDGDISDDEGAGIQWILENLIGDARFATYVESEVLRTRSLSAIQRGVLPAITTPSGVTLNAGEILHFYGKCRYSFLRRRRDQVASDSFDGIGMVTDSRFVFLSQLKSFRILHGSVIGINPCGDTIEVQCSGLGGGAYEFQDDSEFGPEIWLAAVRRSKQTLVAPQEAVNPRHIPRTVRQRVWQRYSGKCADCGANDYLEFDHIIPVARGGGNAENNIQLLCRRCNLKKSDHI